MIAIHDPHIPGLADLCPETLRRITGADDVALLRLRYRAGKRAILHLSTDLGEGAVWFSQGDKASSLAKRNKTTSSFDPASKALFEAFPNDHRLPQIRTFVEGFETIGPALIGGTPKGPPVLLRYRPGLSCTFRCEVSEGAPVFVKLTDDDRQMRTAELNRQMACHLADGPAGIAPVIGTAPKFRAVAYAAAPGRSLEACLVETGNFGAVAQAIDALGQFWAMPLTPERHLSVDALVARAADAVLLISATVPEAAAPVEDRLARIRRQRPRLALRPIHADIKLEHLFIDARRTTLIDTESVSLGPSDYDLAQLFGRLLQAELDGTIPRPIVERATATVVSAAGSTFEWCLSIVALRLAKFHAQRPAPDAACKIRAILERLS